MQKQKKQFVVLIILLVVCVAAYVGLHFYNDKQDKKKAADSEAKKITVTSIKADDIKSFSYQNQNQTLSFKKENGNWVFEGDTTIPIDQNAVSSMLSSVVSLEATDSIKDYQNLSDYGLDKPVNVVKITTADGTITLSFGSENKMLSGNYLLKDGDKNVYLVGTTAKTAFDKSVKDLTKVKSTETEAVSPSAATESK
jgi:hypothetical protein